MVTAPAIGAREQWIRKQCSGTVLDIGSASGWVFRGNELDVTYLDINEYLPDGHKRVVADAHSLPFPDNSFDCCVLGELLEHVHNPILVLKEAVRVARLRVIFTVPDEYHWAAEHAPLRTIEEQVAITGKSVEELYHEGNNTCVKVNDLKQSFHNRWYTQETLEAQLQLIALPYQIETIAYDGWSWFCGVITKENHGV